MELMFLPQHIVCTTAYPSDLALLLDQNGNLENRVVVVGTDLG
jgi:hypothetical protein